MDEHDRKQIEFYERTAEGYDRSVWSLGCRDNRNHETKIRAVAEAIEAGGGGRILEVGVGTGLHARWLLEHTPARHTGVDLSQPMLRIAGERLAAYGDRSSLVIGDALELPFPDEFFDAAFCVGTLHHLPAAQAGLRELTRVVRPGGRVAALEPNWKFPSVLVYSAITPEERKTFRINERSLRRWAAASGLTGVEVRNLLYTPPKPVRWQRMFDRLDARIARVPGVRSLSINLLVSGRKTLGASR